MKKKKINWKHWLPFYIMFIPGLIYMIVNNYMPLYGMQLAFKSFSYSKGIAGSKWIGFKNFVRNKGRIHYGPEYSFV